MDNARGIVATICRENKESYDTETGRAALATVLGGAFTEPWIYACELIQNALDARAKTIEITTGSDQITFQHDGKEPLEEKHVRAMSRLGLSTKGGATVGFMGIGFKSVFKRFLHVAVAGGPWRFRYDVRTWVGARYGDEHTDHIGTVLPEWDELAEPLPEGRTRFALSKPLDATRDPALDLNWLTDSADPTPLAVLALRGLEKLRINDDAWELLWDKANNEVGIQGPGGWRAWRVFNASFTPKPEAIRCLLRQRIRRRSDEERDEDYGRPRSVIGLVPLDDRGVPTPPAHGRLYATLPTQESLPLRMHVNADWLVDITRNGLDEPETNAWQWELLQQIPALLADYLRWLSTRPKAFWQPGLGVLANLEGRDSPLLRALQQDRWRSKLRDAIEKVPFVPVSTASGLAMTMPAEVTLLPAQLEHAFARHPELRPDLLFQGAVLDSITLGASARQLLKDLGLVQELDAATLAKRWGDGPAEWWTALSGDQSLRNSALVSLWAALAALGPEWSELPSIPNSGGGWSPPSQIEYVNEELPSPDVPGGASTLERLGPFLPSTDRQMDRSAFRTLRGQGGDAPVLERQKALTWFQTHAKEHKLSALVQLAADAMATAVPFDPKPLVRLGQWVFHQTRGAAHRPDLVPYLVVIGSEGPCARPREEALVAEPYARSGEARRRIFGLAHVSPAYIEDVEQVSDHAPGTGREWRVFLERCGARGQPELREKATRHGQSEGAVVAKQIGLPAERISQTNKNGYQVIDYSLDVPAGVGNDVLAASLSGWLEDDLDVFRRKGRRQARYQFYSTPYNPIGTEAAAWVRQLASLPWVPLSDGRRVCPREAAIERDDDDADAPVALLRPEFVQLLRDEGVSFAPPLRAPAIRKLVRHGSAASAADLANLITEAAREAAEDSEKRAALQDVLGQITIPVATHRDRVPLARVVTRTGSPDRSTLNGFAAGLNELDLVLREALKAVFEPRWKTTTGAMALDFLESVWKQAAAGERLAADELSAALAQAYRYVREDTVPDAALAQRWEGARGRAYVYARDRATPKSAGWRSVASDVFFDDLLDPSLLRLAGPVTIATAGHFGETFPDQLRTAKWLRIGMLSTELRPDYMPGAARHAPTEHRCFARLCAVIQLSDESRKPLELQTFDVLRLRLQGQEHQIPARRDADVLSVASAPSRYSTKAAALLVEAWRLSQAGDIVPYLTACMRELDDEARFETALSELARHISVDVPPLADADADADADEASHGTNGSETSGPTDTDGHTNGGGALGPTAGAGTQSGLSGSGTSGGSGGGASGSSPKGSGARGGGAPGQAPDRSRWSGSAVAGRGRGHAWANEPNDRRGRAAVLAYERLRQREPEEMPDGNRGFDVRSREASGAERRIEIKSVDGIWTGDASVGLTSPQFDDARTCAEQNVEYWLYVVDQVKTTAPRIHALRNPARETETVYFRAQNWAAAVEEQSAVELALEPLDAGDEVDLPDGLDVDP